MLSVTDWYQAVKSSNSSLTQSSVLVYVWFFPRQFTGLGAGSPASPTDVICWSVLRGVSLFTSRCEFWGQKVVYRTSRLEKAFGLIWGFDKSQWDCRWAFPSLWGDFYSHVFFIRWGGKGIWRDEKRSAIDHRKLILISVRRGQPLHINSYTITSVQKTSCGTNQTSYISPLHEAPRFGYNCKKWRTDDMWEDCSSPPSNLPKIPPKSEMR